MKKLFLVRHAKAVKAKIGEADFNRPLHPQGRKDATWMAEKFSTLVPEKSLFIISPAKRTRATGRYFAKAINMPFKSVHFCDNMYEASVATLLHILENIDNHNGCVTMIGHNPGISLLAEYLTQEPLAFPPCGVAEIIFPFNDWSDIVKVSGKLLNFDFPKKSLA